MTAAAPLPGGSELVDALKELGLTSLAKVVPSVLDHAITDHERQPFEEALTLGLEGRQPQPGGELEALVG
jgi:hypothetical protein